MMQLCEDKTGPMALTNVEEKARPFLSYVPDFKRRVLECVVVNNSNEEIKETT